MLVGLSLRYFIESYLELTISSLINCFYEEFHASFVEILSMAISMLLLIAALLLPFGIIIMIVRF